MSPWPVKKMMGISLRSPAIRSCSSRPFSPGSSTSRIRQFGTSAVFRNRNACADAKVSGFQPSNRISDSSDSRTETSSSTMNTIGLVSDIGDDPHLSPEAGARFTVYHRWTEKPSWACCRAKGEPLLHSNGGIDRFTQRRLAEWFEEAFHGALRKQARAEAVIPVGGDEDDRDFLPPSGQFSLELRTGHARNRKVQDEALS